MTQVPLCSLRSKVLERANVINRRELPIDVVAIAHELGVQEIEPRTMSIDGYLARWGEGQLAIRYRMTASPERIRFTIAHEIGHIIIAEEQGIPILGVVARGPNRMDEEEQLANRFAAEVLIPRRVVVSRLRGKRSSWSLVKSVASECQASVSALLRRIVEVPELRAIEIRVQPGASPRFGPQLNCRSTGRVLLQSQPSIVAAMLLRQAEANAPHVLSLNIDGVDCDVPLIGRLLPDCRKGTYQLFGWPVQRLSAAPFGPARAPGNLNLKER